MATIELLTAPCHDRIILPDEDIAAVPLSQLKPKLVRGGVVLDHVQAWSDDCQRATGATNFGTYVGHDPNQAQALDIFHSIGDDALTDAICDFVLANFGDYYGEWYVISRQRIYNPLVAHYWRPMADRGSPTQNHFDHVHVSFFAYGTARPGTTIEEDELKEDERNAVIFTAQFLEDVKQGRWEPPPVVALKQKVDLLEQQVALALDVLANGDGKYYGKLGGGDIAKGAERAAKLQARER